MKALRALLFLAIGFSFLGVTFISEYKYIGPTVTITDYHAQDDITKADSVLILAMILNRECPTCPFEEKVYLASCFITGAKEAGVSVHDYIFNYKQVWNLHDARISYSPMDNNNLLAAKTSWLYPKHVRFYASSFDNVSHFQAVKKNSVYKGYHYYSFDYD